MTQEELDRAAGAKLKELRQQAGMSQEDASFSANVDQSTLSKVERLGPGVMSWQKFCRVVAALGFSAEIVFRPREDKAANQEVSAVEPRPRSSQK